MTAVVELTSYSLSFGAGLAIGWITRALLGELDKVKSGRHHQTGS